MTPAHWHRADTPSVSPHGRRDSVATPVDLIRRSAPDLTARVWLGVTPPSLNRIAGRGSRFAFAGAKRRWQDDLGMLLLAERLPLSLTRVEASAVLTFPTKRRRDEGNYRTLLEKALGDALVEGGWLDDDTPDRFTFGAVVFAEGAHRTTLTLRCWRAVA